MGTSALQDFSTLLRSSFFLIFFLLQEWPDSPLFILFIYLLTQIYLFAFCFHLGWLQFKWCCNLNDKT